MILSPVDFKWENDWQPEIRTDDLVKHFLWQLGLRLFLLPSASRKPIHLIYDGLSKRKRGKLSDLLTHV